MNNTQNIFQELASKRDHSKFPLDNSISMDNTSSDLDEKPIQGNIFQQLALEKKKAKEDKFDFLETVKDVGKQVLTKGISGFGGAYGNILESVGLQSKQNQLPGQEARTSEQFEVLEKMNRGEAPTFSELLLLSDEEIPSVSRLPTSKDIQTIIEKTTGVGEGKTPSGRIAGRGTEFLSEGLATPGGGVKTLATLAGSGLAGQSIRESGGPEVLALATEILPNILQSIASGKLKPGSEEAKKLVEAGRKLGLTEKQIAPLIQGEAKASTLSKVARKGTKTKKLFESIKDKLGDSYNTIKSSPEAKKVFPKSDQSNIRNEFIKIKDDLFKTLAPSPDRQAALDFVEQSINSLRKGLITPEHLINSWQDINKSIKWNSIQGGKKALAQLKKPIAEALEKASPKLAKDFEMTNELYSKYAQISKKLKPDVVESIFNKAELLSIPAAGTALIYGNPYLLTGVAGEFAVRTLAREMLINPYFQNLGNKLVKNFNQGSIKGITESVKKVKEYMERKHPNEDWSFLINDSDKD